MQSHPHSNHLTVCYRHLLGLLALALIAGCLPGVQASGSPSTADEALAVELVQQALAPAAGTAMLRGFIDIDGSRQQVQGAVVRLQFEQAASEAARGEGMGMMGMTVSESFSIQNGTLTTSSTVTSADGKTTTTTTTTTNINDGSSTTTTTVTKRE